MAENSDSGSGSIQGDSGGPRGAGGLVQSEAGLHLVAARALVPCPP